MFKKLTARQREYYKDFTLGQIPHIKSRIQLLCILSVALYLLGSLISIAILPEDFKSAEVPWITTFAIFGFAISFFIGRVHSMKATKVFAYLFVVVILTILTKVSIIYQDQENMAEVIYLFTLFLISFTVPWKPAEIIPITLMHTTAYQFLFWYTWESAPGHARVPDFYQSDFLPLVSGLLILSLGFIFCFVIRKKEASRDLENFILLKEVEKKNKQMRKELELATKIHKTLIPKSIYTDLVDVAVMYLPVYYIGGDYAKFHLIDKNKLVFIICDVTGHGVSAALLVNRVHSEFERLAKEGKGPGILLKELNDFIVNDFEGTDMYLSAFCCTLDFEKMKVSYSNHGHPSQYIYRVTESNIEHLDPQAGLLGLPFMASEIVQQEMSFTKGDKLLLFTDGVIETRNGGGNEFGKERVEDFIKENHSLQVDSFNRKLIDTLNGFKSKSFDDDIFIVTIDVKS